MIRLLQRLLGDRSPGGFLGSLDQEEHVLATAETEGGMLVATSYGLWTQHGESARRVGWHLISKATWGAGSLSIVETEETGRAGSAVRIADRRPVRFALPMPGKLPRVVREKVDSSILSRYRKELPDGGGAWFVQRKVPGAGQVLQVRPDPGTDTAIISAIAEEAAAKLGR